MADAVVVEELLDKRASSGSVSTGTLFTHAVNVILSEMGMQGEDALTFRETDPRDLWSRRAINGLLDRFSDIRLDPEAPFPQVSGDIVMRGMTSVPVLLN